MQGIKKESGLRLFRVKEVCDDSSDGICGPDSIAGGVINTRLRARAVIDTL